MKTLATLLTGVALIALPTTGNSIGLSIGGGSPDLSSILKGRSIIIRGEIEPEIPRVILIRGFAYPQQECFKEYQGYTTIVLNLSESETFADAYSDLERLNLRQKSISRWDLTSLEREIFKADFFWESNLSDTDDSYLLAWSKPDALVTTFYQECPKQQLPKTKYLEGRITEPQAIENGSSFTLDAEFGLFEGKVFLESGLRLMTDGTARLYSNDGFSSSDKYINTFDKLEVVDKKGKVLFTYGPQRYYSSYRMHNVK